MTLPTAHLQDGAGLSGSGAQGGAATSTPPQRGCPSQGSVQGNVGAVLRREATPTPLCPCSV